MSHADAAWLHMDQPTNLMVITGVLWFDEPPDWEGVREVDQGAARRAVSRAFASGSSRGRGRSRGRTGRTTRTSTSTCTSIASPSGRRATAPRSRTFVADLMAKPLDRSQPLWEFHLVDGYGDGAAIVARIHHCIADGIALARVLLSLTDESPDAGIAPRRRRRPASSERRGPLQALVRPAARAARGARRGGGRARARGDRGRARHPSHLRDLAATAREDADALAKVLLDGRRPADAALKGELGVAQRVAWSAPIPLDEVQAIGHATGTTVNDVAARPPSPGRCAATSPAATALVDELTAIVPFNLRPLDQPLPPELGNRFGLVFLPLPVGIEDRATAARTRCTAGWSEIKHSPEGAISYGVLDAIGRTPGADREAPGRPVLARRAAR